MKTHGPFNLHPHRLRILAVLASLALALPVQASFHLMQIEQVIGGVNGDTTAQAIQLRMRSGGENLVSGGTLIAYDAAGNNPIVLVTFGANVTNGAAGTRILITTANFADYLSSPIASDFTMTNSIPASYLAAGRLTYQRPTYMAGNALWSISWGGAGYTGANTGTMDNDADGNFAPPFANALPSASTSALHFNGAANAMSTNNAADYSVPAGAATFMNNAGESATVIVGTPTPTPTPTPTASPSTLANISTRLRVEPGDNVLIGGFIVTGTQPKRVIARAIGPSLTLTGVLANPVLELHGPGAFSTITNDDWRSDQETEIMATTIPPTNDLESAIVSNLPANNSAFTAIVRGVNDGTGIGVVEAYDLDGTVDSKLANISTRGLVQTGDNVLIGGFIIVGQLPLRVIVRAIGPSLGVSGELADPTLELRDSDGVLIDSNDNWRSDHESDIMATTIPPSNDLESAIVRDLVPGTYTVVVRGVNDAAGVGLVEAYSLN
jgi:hypothetical protein